MRRRCLSACRILMAFIFIVACSGCSGRGVVQGRTIHLAFGCPIGMPRIPRQLGLGDAGVPSVTIFFRSSQGDYTTTSDAHGRYRVTLPPDTYRIGWLSPWELCEPDKADPYRHGTYSVRVLPGWTHDKDLVVSWIFIN